MGHIRYILPPHALDLVIICPALRPMNKKIKLYLCTVHMPVVIHHHGFRAAAIHNGKQIQYADRLLLHILIHFFILSIHFKRNNTPAAKFSLQQAKNTHQCGGK